jgi:hypothetical protein
VKRALALAIAACRRDPIASCDDDLRGVYLAASERWMVLDQGPTLEAYPLFPDGAAPGSGSVGDSASLEIAPRMIDLERTQRSAATSAEISGTLHRRYLQRAEMCDAHVPVHVTRCAGETIELVLADPAPPIAFAPCAWPGPGPSRVVHWRRE